MTERQTQRVWTVGADATLQFLFDDPGCPGLLRRALSETQSWQVRNETTIRRVLKASQLMPQCVATLLALGAMVTVEVEGAPEGGAGPSDDETPLEDFLEQRMKGQVAALHIPIPGAHVRCGEAHVARAPAEEPIVAAVAAVKVSADRVEETRVALTGVWPEPVRLAEASGGLVGEPLSAESIRAVAAAVEQEADPREDFMGSAAYRRAMAAVLTRRALEACAAEFAAGGGR